MPLNTHDEVCRGSRRTDEAATTDPSVTASSATELEQRRSATAGPLRNPLEPCKAQQSRRENSMDAKTDSWYAMPHSDFLKWAGIELGDTRQVYARDRRRPLDAPLVFMPDGEADRFRQDAWDGHLICPVPGCPYPALFTRHGEDRRDHFVHAHAPELHHKEFPTTVTQQILHRWAASLDPRLEVLDQQTIAGVPVTVLVRSPSGNSVALCYTSGVLGAEAWEAQHAALESQGVAGVWLFPPRRWYFALPEPIPAPSQANAAGLVVDKHLHKVMRRNGSWPLIINIEREEFANLIVPRRGIAGRLHLQPPPYAEGVLHVVISALDSCRLCKDGVVTSAVNERDLEKIRGGYLKRTRGYTRPPARLRTAQPPRVRRPYSNDDGRRAAVARPQRPQRESVQPVAERPPSHLAESRRAPQRSQGQSRAARNGARVRRFLSSIGWFTFIVLLLSTFGGHV